MRNITLIGMPGAGKSTVGVVLAKLLGLDFIDSDLLIQAREGRLLWRIIDSEGIEGFWRVEERVNASIEADGAVIATGGSVVYGPKAMEHLRKMSTVVYLKHDYSTIGRPPRRPVEARESRCRRGGRCMICITSVRRCMKNMPHIIFDCGHGDIRSTALALAARLSGE